MNDQEYIAYGALELYALGHGSDEERLEVEARLAQSAELRSELEAIMASLETYGEAHSVQPPTHLKDQIMKKIVSMESDHKVVVMEPSQDSRTNWLAAASISLLIMSLVGNGFLFSRYSSTKDELSALEQKSSTLAQDLDVTRAQYNSSQKELAMMSGAKTDIIEMSGLPISPESKATIYWDKQTGELYLSVNELPVPQADKQYQLWAIVDGTPVDAGVFEMADLHDGLIKMKSFDHAQAFAVTLEKKGGSIAPTLELMYVVGNV